MSGVSIGRDDVRVALRTDQEEFGRTWQELSRSEDRIAVAAALNPGLFVQINGHCCNRECNREVRELGLLGAAYSDTPALRCG